MDGQSRERLDDQDDTVEASDFSTVPEGVRGYVDLIGDENVDGWRTGEPTAGNND